MTKHHTPRLLRFKVKERTDKGPGAATSTMNMTEFSVSGCLTKQIQYNPSGLQILTKHVGYVGLNPGQRQQSRCNVWHPPFEKRLLLVHVAPISLQSLTSCSLHFILLSLHLPCLVPVFFHITIDNSISYQTCSNRAKTTLV